MYAVIRVRGGIGVRREIRDTLSMLGLKRVNWCVLIPEEASYKGMIAKVKDYVTWGPVDVETVSKLIDRDGQDLGDYESPKELAAALVAGDIRVKLKPVRLSPPRGGYEGIKRPYPRGALGLRKDIGKLLERML